MDHAELLAKANVVAVGTGYKMQGGQPVLVDGEPVIATVVSVTEKVGEDTLDMVDAVPGFDAENMRPTDVVEVGEIRIVNSLTSTIDPTQRIRPVHPGLSVALNPQVTAGTIGFIVEKVGQGSQNYILSNWHVIAASNVPVIDRENVLITQPGTHDNGTVPDDVIDDLNDFVPVGGSLIPDLSDCNIGNGVARVANGIARMMFSRTRLQAIRPQAEGDQLVDAALGILHIVAERGIPQIGQPFGEGRAELGMQVQKYGRTTQYTSGEVTQVDMSVLVQGYPEGPVLFVDQVAITGSTGPFLQGGDSGSGLLWGAKAVGLCFAGSDTIGIANQFPNVADALGIQLARS